MIYRTEREYNSKTLLKDGDYKSIGDMLTRINAMIPQNQILAELESEAEE